jgi:hypothetical protein
MRDENPLDYLVKSLQWEIVYVLALRRNGQGYSDAALTFDACSVSLRQLNSASVVELTFAAIAEA